MTSSAPFPLPTEKDEPQRGLKQCTLRFTLDNFPREAVEAAGIELPFSLRSAVKKRQYEFLASRYCAQLCLEDLGLSPAPQVGFALDRSPTWPDGFVGSITHTEGWASAVVGRRSDFLSIGIDIEHRIADATPQMVQHICHDPGESERLRTQLQLSAEEALTMIFSAKETLYKAIYPRVKSFFGFHAAAVEADASGLLHISLLTDLNDQLRAGQRWPLQQRRRGEDLFETLLIEIHGVKSP